LINKEFWEGNEEALRSGYNRERRIPEFKFGLAETITERKGCIQSQSFSAYCLKIWQGNQFIVTQVA
jgi:hypothetical protein